MTVAIDRDSTEFLYVGVSGTVPEVSAEVALVEAGQRPGSEDWGSATIVDDQHELWADARASGATGDYYVAVLVGSYGDTGVALAEGDYQMWLRLTDTTERPVRITPEAVKVL